jgi:hypothetical protein
LERQAFNNNRKTSLTTFSFPRRKSKGFVPGEKIIHLDGNLEQAYTLIRSQESNFFFWQKEEKEKGR